MVLVRVRVLLGKKLLGEPVRPFAPEVTVEAVVEAAVTPFEGIMLIGTVDVFNDPEEKKRRAQLPIDSLGNITVGELMASGYGTNLVSYVERTATADIGSPNTPCSSSSSSSRPSSLPNSLQKMMEHVVERELVLPTPATGPYLYHTIFNALLTELKSMSLGWHRIDVAEGASGHNLLMALSKALQYALPFDVNGALKRRSIHIPDRFKLDSLGVTLPSGHHGATREGAVDEQLRLDTQKLLDHANAVAGTLDGADAAKWGRLECWQPFLVDTLNLALALDKLGSGSLAKARRVREANARTEPLRTPADPNFLNVKPIAASPPTDPKMFAMLASVLRGVEEYTPVRVLDEHMGITQLTETPGAVRRQYYLHMKFADFDIKQYLFSRGGPYPSIGFVLPVRFTSAWHCVRRRRRPPHRPT